MNDSPATPPPEPRLVGWKAIATALDVDEDTAHRYAHRDYDPLPVRVDHAGRHYLYVSALRSWVNRQDLPVHAYSELRARNLLPGQLRRDHRSPVTGRIMRSGAQRVGMTKAAKRNQGRGAKPYAAAIDADGALRPARRGAR